VAPHSRDHSRSGGPRMVPRHTLPFGPPGGRVRCSLRARNETRIDRGRTPARGRNSDRYGTSSHWRPAAGRCRRVGRFRRSRNRCGACTPGSAPINVTRTSAHLGADRIAELALQPSRFLAVSRKLVPLARGKTLRTAPFTIFDDSMKAVDIQLSSLHYCDSPEPSLDVRWTSRFPAM